MIDANKRILVVDDDMDIWRVYKAVLAPETEKVSSSQKMARLMDPDLDTEKETGPKFELSFAAQGKDSFEMVKEAIERNMPFAVAFIDIRMPPGWDGMDTAAKIRELDPHIEIVIVTAYSDRSREEIVQTVGAPEKLLLLRKPFDHEELTQMALSLTEKWNLATREEDQRRKLETVLITSPAAIFTVDADRYVTSWNPAAVRITGYRAAEVIGNRCLIEDISKTDVCDECCMLSDNPSENAREIVIRDKEGKTKIISKSVRLIKDDSGRIVMGVESFWDISEIRKAQAYVKNIIDSMPSILISVDADGAIIQWNTEAERSAERTIDEVRGEYVGNVFPPVDDLLKDLDEIFRNRKPAKLEKHAVAMGNKKRYLDMVIYPLVTNGVEGAVIRLDDVTARVRFEEMMIQSEKMMSVGGLAAGMAHEINNPLGVILQGIQNTFRRLSPDLETNNVVADKCGAELETVRRYLKTRGIFRFLNGIQEAGVRASRIVSNMLNFSRTGEFRMVRADINKLVDNSVDLADNDYDLRNRFNFRKIKITREYSPNLPLVPCDITEIEQVVLNLLKNSAQALMETGNQPEIFLRTKWDNTHALIEIEDNGPGMDGETCKRIFEPFYTTKGVGMGTGLGLSVSYFIITNNHKGEMSVDSEPGKGAKFTIRLPLG